MESDFSSHVTWKVVIWTAWLCAVDMHLVSWVLCQLIKKKGQAHSEDKQEETTKTIIFN
jgi:hypothetical protein